MFTIINKDGGVWGTCDTREEAEAVCLANGYEIEGLIKEAVVEEPKKKVVKKTAKKASK